MEEQINLSKNKLKVLYINTAFYGGGAEKVMRQLYSGMVKEYEIETFCIVGWEKRAHDKIHVIYHDFFHKAWNVILRGKSDSARKHDRYALKEIIKIIRQQKIDVVHFHNITGNYLGIADIQKIAEECPLVWTLHDMWAVTGHCAYAIECRKWKKSNCDYCDNLGRYPRVARNKTRRLFCEKGKSFTNHNIFYVTPSKWLEKVIRESFLANEKILSIENGVNCDTYGKLDKKAIRVRKNFPLDRQIFLFAASGLNNPYKGLDVLIEALNECGCKREILLVVVGNGKLAGLDECLEVSQQGTARSEKEMNELYALSDVFIIPSKAENYPCSILESMASGTPVIGSDVGGISEQIEDGTGWLFQAGDVKALKTIIEDIVQGKYNLNAYSDKCRRIAEEKFNENIMLKKYYELYLEVVKGGKEEDFFEKNT